MPQRLDQIWIALHDREVPLTSASRWALLTRMSGHPIGDPGQNETIFEAFRRVGTDRPVKLDPDGKTHLLAVLRRWSFDADRGYSGLPKGLLQLSNALRDDLYAAERVD